MTKIISLSLTDHAWDTYLKDLETINRSKQIERWIILGYEAEIGENESTKTKLLQTHKQFLKVKDERDTLAKQVGILKHELKEAKEEKKRKRNIRWIDNSPVREYTQDQIRKPSKNFIKQIKEVAAGNGRRKPR